MNNDEAKFILRAYRPSGGDANDATFATALEQSRNDPKLGAWFAREQEYDAVIAEKLETITPPAGLRERILAGGKVSQPVAAPRRHWGSWLALAASLAVVFSLSEVWLGKRVEAAQRHYAEFAVNDMQNAGHHPPEGEGMEEMLRMLARPDIRLPGSLALSFDKLKAGGCRTVKYGERDAIEVCFNRDGTWYHLYMMPRVDSLDPLLARRKSSYLAMNDSAVAVWSDRDYDYAVVGPKGMSDLKRLAG